MPKVISRKRSGFGIDARAFCSDIRPRYHKRRHRVVRPNRNRITSTNMRYSIATNLPECVGSAFSRLVLQVLHNATLAARQVGTWRNGSGAAYLFHPFIWRRRPHDISRKLLFSGQLVTFFSATRMGRRQPTRDNVPGRYFFAPYFGKLALLRAKVNGPSWSLLLGSSVRKCRRMQHQYGKGRTIAHFTSPPDFSLSSSQVRSRRPRSSVQ